MKYITEENSPIFDKEDELYQEADRLHKEWKEEAMKARNDEGYMATKEKFDESIKALDERRKFRNENYDTLSGSECE